MINLKLPGSLFSCLRLRLRVSAEERAEAGDVTEQRHLVDVLRQPIFHQAADHDRLSVRDGDATLSRSLVDDGRVDLLGDCDVGAGEGGDAAPACGAHSEDEDEHGR